MLAQLMVRVHRGVRLIVRNVNIRVLYNQSVSPQVVRPASDKLNSQA